MLANCAWLLMRLRTPCGMVRSAASGGGHPVGLERLGMRRTLLLGATRTSSDRLGAGEAG